MPGELVEDIVVVADQKEGGQIYNKGNYGYPISGGGVNLDLLEATYLLESERLEVFRKGSKLTFGELFDHSSSVHEDFDIRYIVYRDIRQRGFVIKNESGEFDFSVFPRGKIMSNSRPEFLVSAVSERTAFSMSEFSVMIGTAEKKGKKLLYGVVDEEGDLTYYVVSRKQMTGAVKFDDVKANGRLIRDRVFIFDNRESEEVHKNGFFGKMISGMLQLSLIESCYLMGKGMLSVTSSSGPMGTEDIKKIGKSIQDEFQVRLETFSDLRDNGLLVKTGFKYGTHFRVYERSPDVCHARYLVHSVPENKKMTWPELSRTVRLAHGVKKEILFRSGEYIEFSRFRP